MYTGYFIGEDCYIHDEHGGTDWYYGGDRRFYLSLPGRDVEALGYYLDPEDGDWSNGPILREPGIWTGYVLEAGHIHGPGRALPWKKSDDR